MNFMGMGMLEMGIILLVAFLALGPNRSIDMARTAGRLFRELQRTFSEIASSVNLEQGQDLPSRRRASPPPDDPEDRASRDQRDQQ